MRIDSVTVTLHTAGGDTYPLPLIGGTIALDATAYPYAQSTLTIPLPDDAMRAALNPIGKPRVMIVASVAGTSRTFDLRVQSVTTSAASDTLTLDLESDEGALMNTILTPNPLAPLAPDVLAELAAAQARIDALVTTAGIIQTRQADTAQKIGALSSAVTSIQATQTPTAGETVDAIRAAQNEASAALGLGA